MLHSEADDGATITVELIGGTHDPVTLDEDGICILRIASTTQSVKIIASKAGSASTVKTYALTDLTLEEGG